MPRSGERSKPSTEALDTLLGGASQILKMGSQFLSLAPIPALAPSAAALQVIIDSVIVRHARAPGAPSAEQTRCSQKARANDESARRLARTIDELARTIVRTAEKANAEERAGDGAGDQPDMGLRLSADLQERVQQLQRYAPAHLTSPSC